MLHARPSEAMSDLDPPTDQLSFKEHHPFPFRLPPSLRPSVSLSDAVSVAAAFLPRPSSDCFRFFGHDESRTVVNHVQERAEKFTIPMEAFPLSLAEILPRTV